MRVWFGDGLVFRRGIFVIGSGFFRLLFSLVKEVGLGVV